MPITQQSESHTVSKKAEDSDSGEAYKKVANEGKRVSIFEIKEKRTSKGEKITKRAIRSVASVPGTFISDLSVGGFAPGKQPAYPDLSVCAGTSGEEALRGDPLVVMTLIEQRSWS